MANKKAPKQKKGKKPTNNSKGKKIDSVGAYC